MALRHYAALAVCIILLQLQLASLAIVLDRNIKCYSLGTSDNATSLSSCAWCTVSFISSATAWDAHPSPELVDGKTPGRYTELPTSKEILEGRAVPATLIPTSLVPSRNRSLRSFTNQNSPLSSSLPRSSRKKSLSLTEIVLALVGGSCGLFIVLLVAMYVIFVWRGRRRHRRAMATQAVQPNLQGVAHAQPDIEASPSPQIDGVAEARPIELQRLSVLPGSAAENQSPPGYESSEAATAGQTSSTRSGEAESVTTHESGGSK